jgi:hypothetical protein
MMEDRHGHYLGTEIDGKWWKRYRGTGFFARGNGMYWLNDEALHFQKFLTSSRLRIPYEKMKAITVGTWHAGRWKMGRPIVKVIWEHKGQHLSSGFFISGSESATQHLVRKLKNKMSESGQSTSNHSES